MRLAWTPDFDAEREAFSLRFCCEDCAHFDAASDGCRHEWPNAEHRRQHSGDAIDFCKEFELC